VQNILEIKDLSTFIYDAHHRGFYRIVDGVSFDVPQGQTTALIGESGSGKSSVAYSLLGLVPDEPGIVSGSIVLHVNGTRFDLLARLPEACRVSEKDGVVEVQKDARLWRKTFGYDAMMKRIRGRHIAIMMQEARSALNPYQTVRQQVEEAYLIGGGAPELARDTVDYLFRELHIYDKADAFPHNLSGGLCHRAMMAVAFAANPDLLIADEPTTGLDCPLQIKVVDLLMRYKEGRLMPDDKGNPRAILLVSHQVEIVEKLADQVAVMYGGQVMESGASDVILSGGSIHPYAQKIIQIYQEPPELISQDSGARLISIPGFVPSALTLNQGCRFEGRCEHAMSVCNRVSPRLVSVDTNGGHHVSCHLYDAEAQPLRGAS